MKLPILNWYDSKAKIFFYLMVLASFLMLLQLMGGITA